MEGGRGKNGREIQLFLSFFMNITVMCLPCQTEEREKEVGEQISYNPHNHRYFVIFFPSLLFRFSCAPLLSFLVVFCFFLHPSSFHSLNHIAPSFPLNVEIISLLLLADSFVVPSFSLFSPLMSPHLLHNHIWRRFVSFLLKLLPPKIKNVNFYCGKRKERRKVKKGKRSASGSPSNLHRYLQTPHNTGSWKSIYLFCDNL